MTKLLFLEALKQRTENEIKDLILPVRLQKGDAKQEYRPAAVYKMRLPDSSAAQKKAPYIIHQIITAEDAQAEGKRIEARTTVRSIFCVYHNDEQEGALALLNLMERLRISLLRDPIVDNRYELDLKAKVEGLLYPEDTAPYFAGEMKTVWKLPAVEREVQKWLMP